MGINSKKREKQKGTAMIEMAIGIVMFWTPLFWLTYQMGFTLVRQVAVTQVCRDAAHMYSQGIDFTTSQYQTLLSSLMPGYLTMSSSGNTTVVFSYLILVQDCTAAGYSSGSTSCNNYGKTVVEQQIVLGSTASSSHLVTPPSSICTSANRYTITAANYETNAGVVVSNPPITLSSSNPSAYVAEVIVNSSDLTFWSKLGNAGNYTITVF